MQQQQQAGSSQVPAAGHGQKMDLRLGRRRKQGSMGID
jgi:hypothetical protein